MRSAARPAPPWRTPPRRDSWGGRAVVLMLLGAYGYNVVDRLVDGAHVVLDGEGRPELVGHGHAATVFGVGMFVAAVACACLACLAARTRRSSPSLVVVTLQALVLWWALLSVLIPRTPMGLADYVIVGAVPLIFGVVSDPPTLRSLRWINLLRDALAVGQVVYALADPVSGQIPCRPDKCGLFGSMTVGFFVQENSAPAALAAMLPLAGMSATWRRLAVSVGVALFAVAASGSRTGLLAVVLASLVAVVIKVLTARQTPPVVRVPRLVRVAPLVATIISLGIFLLSDAESLTGRGAIYAAIREQLVGPALLYGVPWDTVVVASNGYLTGDHGQASHLLAKAGLVGLVLWFVAMVGIACKPRYTLSQLLALGVLLALLPEMLTESPLELSARSIGFASLLVVAGLFSIGEPRAPDRPRVVSPRRTGLALGVAGVTLVAALALPYVAGPRYRAAQTLGVTTSPVENLEQLSDASAPSWTTATSVRALIPGPVAAAAAGDSGIPPERLHASNLPHTSVVELSADSSDEASARSAVDHVRRTGESMNAAAGPGPATHVRPLGAISTVPLTPWQAHGLSAGAVGLAGGLLALALGLPSSRALPREREGTARPRRTGTHRRTHGAVR